MYDLLPQDTSYHVLLREREVDRILQASNLGSITMLDSPVHDFLKLPAFMTGVEVRVGSRVVLYPVPCDHHDLGIARDRLPDQFDAVI
jgi:hypothetical protein